MKRAAAAALGACVCVLSLTTVAPAETIDIGNPFEYFNVYSLGDIGSAGASFTGQVYGRAGAGGDAWLTDLTVLNMPTMSGWGLHAGGSISFSGTSLGGIDAGGGVALGEIGINGSVHSGGDITQVGGGGAGISGDVLACGSASVDPATFVGGQVLPGQPYAPTVNHAEISQYFLDLSAAVGEMTPTGEFVEEYDGLTLVAGAGVNVVTIDAQTLFDALTVTIDAPTGAVVYINVLDASASLDHVGWICTGGIDAADVLVNLPWALSLELSDVNAVNILAPSAAATMDSAVVAGTLVVGSLSGGGQIDGGAFRHGQEVPEPATLLLLTAGAAALLKRRQPVAEGV